MSQVFGIPVEGEPIDQIVSRVLARSQDQKPFWIVTANPEILLHARQDEEYAKVLKQADMRTVDGFGLWFLLRLAGQKTVRVPGVELAEALIAIAEKKGWRAALVGGGPGIAAQAAENMKRRHPALVILAEDGGTVGRDGTDDPAGEEARHRLTLAAPHVLFAAFGHPKQERWIARHLAEFPGLKLIIGIGGSVDFWAGIVRRAPSGLRAAGLEWLWRLIVEPRRARRIWNAVVVFPFAFLIDRMKRNG